MSLSLPRPTKSDHKQVWHLAAPSIIANLSVPLLGAVDTAVIGHLDQSYYLGAVAIGAVIFHFIYWGFGFLRMGTTGLTAQAFGAREFGEARAIFYRALALGTAIGLRKFRFFGSQPRSLKPQTRSRHWPAPISASAF